MHTRSNAKCVEDIELEEKGFLDVLGALIGYSEWLQNAPPRLLPRENLAADTVVNYLESWSLQSGGPLDIRKVSYKEGRSHVIIRYAAAEKTDKIVSFVGSHMDVVAANPEEWDRNPFELQRDGDKLYGRGVTDCLGHVAMFCNFFKQLAQLKPSLKINVAAVLICDEEFGKDPTIGIFELLKQGELAFLQHGPVYWVDSANFGPTMGTGGMQQWKLKVIGKKCHSGMPQDGINPINLGHDVIRYVQTKFYQDFPKTAQAENVYKFMSGSSLKPTQIEVPKGSINQVPSFCILQGDIRLTPFYEMDVVKKAVLGYLKEFEEKHMESAHIKEGYGRYILPKESLKGKIEWSWEGEPMKAIAVNLDSFGYKVLNKAIGTVRGEAKPFSLTGSLPVIRDLQVAGFDVQITGFGKHEAYHAVNEWGLLSDFKDGCKIVAKVVNELNNSM